MSATTHRPQLEPVDLTINTTNTEDHLQTFLQRVKEGRTELTIQKVETSPSQEDMERLEMQRLEILSNWSKSRKAHKCNYKGCDKVSTTLAGSRKTRHIDCWLKLI